MAERGRAEGTSGRRGGRGLAGFLAVFEAIALAVQLQDVDVVGQSIEQRAGRIAQISAGTLRFDELVRDYTRDRLGFRFSHTTDADSIEDAIRAGRWPHGKRPKLNPK